MRKVASERASGGREGAGPLLGLTVQRSELAEDTAESFRVERCGVLCGSVLAWSWRACPTRAVSGVACPLARGPAVENVLTMPNAAMTANYAHHGSHGHGECPCSVLRVPCTNTSASASICVRAGVVQGRQVRAPDAKVATLSQLAMEACPVCHCTHPPVVYFSTQTGHGAGVPAEAPADQV